MRIAGPPGVGKSTAAWAMATRLAASGVATGHVDIDQLGMCYPAPENDPDRWMLKEEALRRVVAVHRDAGVQELIVSGVADSAAAPAGYDGVWVRSVWLDAGASGLRTRLASRAWSREQIESTVEAGTAQSARLSTGWTRIDTDRRGPGEVLDVLHDLRRSTEGQRTGRSQPVDGILVEPPPAAAVGEAVWITGARCAGSSRIGWELALRRRAAGHRTAFIDLAQLSFAWNASGTVGAEALRTVVSAFAEVGADSAVIVAPTSADPVAMTAIAMRRTRVRLVPSEERRVERILARTRGGGPILAGDDLIGQSEDVALRLAAVPSRPPLRPDEIEIDANGTVDEVADLAADAAGW